MPLDANIAKWSVTTIEIDSQKRHLDRAKLLAFWDELDKYEFFLITIIFYLNILNIEPIINLAWSL